MTIADADRFYKQDDKEYLVKNNSSLISFLYDLKKKGYHSLLEIDEMQDFIHNIQTWYEIKYPNRELDAMDGIIHNDFKDIRTLSAVMDMRQFMFRLPHRQTFFLEGGYRAKGWGSNNAIFITINGRPDYTELYSFTHTPMFFVQADYTTGEVKLTDELCFMLGEDSLEQNKKMTLDELYAIFSRKISDCYDLSELRNSVFYHNCDFELRNRLLQLAALQLLYSKNTSPEKGYFRAKQFIKEFNESLGLQLSTEQIDEIMRRDYSKDDTSGKKGFKCFFKKKGVN